MSKENAPAKKPPTLLRTPSEIHKNAFYNAGNQENGRPKSAHSQVKAPLHTCNIKLPEFRSARADQQPARFAQRPRLYALQPVKYAKNAPYCPQIIPEHDWLSAYYRTMIRAYMLSQTPHAVILAAGRAEVASEDFFSRLYTYDAIECLHVYVPGEIECFTLRKREVASLVLNAPALKRIDVAHNHLRSLDVAQCARLVFLRCTDNQLTVADLRGLNYLRFADFSRNSIEQVKLEGAAALEDLILPNNRIETLDAEHLAQLRTVHVDGLKLRRLALPKGLQTLVFSDCEAAGSREAEARVINYKKLIQSLQSQVLAQQDYIAALYMADDYAREYLAQLYQHTDEASTLKHAFLKAQLCKAVVALLRRSRDDSADSSM